MDGRTLLVMVYNYTKAHDQFYDRIGGAQNRLVFEDLLAGDRNQGETLSYKIVANNSAYDGKYCGYQNNLEGFVNADINGDRRMEYIPNNVYDSVWIAKPMVCICNYNHATLNRIQMMH